MIDLGLNQYKIKEIKYEVKEGKTVIFKFRNFNLEDVDIVLDDAEVVEETKEENTKIEEECEKYEKPKELHDYKPFSCLKTEKGMQETLDASRKREWKEDVITKPFNPTETGNVLIPVDSLNVSENKKYPLCATKKEVMDFYKVQKVKDLKQDKEFRNRYEKKLVNDLVKSKKLIDDYTTKMTEIERERFLDRAKNNYFKLDPNDTFSSIKSLSDLNNLNANYSSLTSNEAKMKPISDTKANNRDRKGLDKITKEFKQ